MLPLCRCDIHIAHVPPPLSHRFMPTLQYSSNASIIFAIAYNVTCNTHFMTIGTGTHAVRKHIRINN